MGNRTALLDWLILLNEASIPYFLEISSNPQCRSEIKRGEFGGFVLNIFEKGRKRDANEV